MVNEAAWERACLLVQQQRWELAERELRGVLAAAPEFAMAHAMLAVTQFSREQLDEALGSARRAIALQPDLPWGHHVLALTLRERGDLPAAKAAATRAIELDPDEPDYFAHLAQIQLHQRQWKVALQTIDDGLQRDPEHIDLLNLRAIALTKLGRGAEAVDSVDASLARDPDNPLTHQARGFALLHRGDAARALHHFQEALRRDPQLDASRAGLVEALKARNPIYRRVLAWFLWLNRFSPRTQLMIAIGLMLLTRTVAASLDKSSPNAAMAVRFAWLGFVLLTACAVPLFNLLLLLHPLGRHALPRRALGDAIVLGASMTVGVGVGLHAALVGAVWSSFGWLFWLMFLLPVAGIGLFNPGITRWLLQAFCVGCAGVWIWWAVQAGLLERDAPNATPEAFRLPLLSTLILSCALSTWYVLLAPKGKARRRRG